MTIRFLDKTLVCEDCKEEFVWYAGEQEFYAVVGLGSEPKRCPKCRRIHRYATRKPPVRHTVTCALCGAETVVPFVPRLGKPVYCRRCYEQLKEPIQAA
jgi:CxxC-x17-CxxC domain-containing protein